MTLDIANQVKEVQVIDISSKMLDIATRKALDYNIENIDFV
jgi:ubiquinone/menaquinone biosynthesis C-methylase UbiE